MTNKRICVGLGIFLLAAAATAALAGPSMSSAWLEITIVQDECIKRGTTSMRNMSFNTRFEVVDNNSIYGERGDYTALIRCAAEQKIVYFVVSGPTGNICSSHMNAMRDDF